MKKGKIMWVDDEIELLKAHILFLKSRGFDVQPVSNGNDAVKLVAEENYDLVLLDEMMAGKDGLTTLSEIKDIKPGLPVIMVTKNEEESLMEKAIGRKITDYLTKPVNPSQVLMACKKILEQNRISSEHVSKNYMEEFHAISRRLYDDLDSNDWIDIYRKLARWDIEFDDHPDLGLKETLEDQVRDCNIEYGKYIEKHYAEWVNEDPHFRPTLSPDIVRKFLFPRIKNGEKLLFIVIDCMRLDQWLTFEPLLYDFYNISTDYYFSLLPSATPYARNAIFSGMFPSEINRVYSDIWNREDDDESSMNQHEGEMIQKLFAEELPEFKRSMKYIKVLDSESGWAMDRKLSTYLENPFIALVVNFVDVLAHRRSESELLKEIVPNEASYRSVVRTWFQHSWIFSVLKKFAEYNFTIVITSDHGSIRVQNDVKVVGDKETSTNIRFKYGRNLNIHQKYALVIKDPEEYKLPAPGINTNYLIAKENFYFVYPTNYHKFQSHYRNTFQHGGISMEETILPFITLTPK
ncbi:MAG: PglZ domain-containing protein [Candidatus Marinimicrobia bacterium]|nr:PglZ domain-containing protein [Candidatus Neomarinimicrobiota bacterium]RKY61967.1 MAG: PglZ domain-containing protein [Candidatus Neomarinimicrobiota bacterium]